MAENPETKNTQESPTEITQQTDQKPHPEKIFFNGRKLTYEEFRQEVLAQYRLGWVSRACSVIGRKEVLSGKAKFGIFGDGKEVAQLAMAKVFKPGDWRAGYYRDQTLMMALGLLTPAQFFAQLYADPEDEHDPHSYGRQMNSHFATHSLDEKGQWKDLTKQPNSSADTSPTSSQMARAVGLALASKLYRENPELHRFKEFSNNGNEVCFATIGDGSCAEGLFWEAVNAAGVMQVPLAVFIWDDGYAISVPKKYQLTKEDIAQLFEGFRPNEKDKGIDVYQVRGWNYAECVQVFTKAIEKCRQTHRPCIIHVTELTQPQGHSTSGSHERYKPPERLHYEKEMDCLKKMREWILEKGLATTEELDQIEKEAWEEVRREQQRAWNLFQNPIKEERAQALELIYKAAQVSQNKQQILQIAEQLRSQQTVLRRDVATAVRHVLALLRFNSGEEVEALRRWYNDYAEKNRQRFNTYLYSQSKESALNIGEVKPRYPANPEMVYGFQILNRCFDEAFRREPRLVAFGEDVGRLGDVNQGFAGLQQKYGELRVFDTGIREATIIGQAIGLAMRGLRPIAEIQYLDYLIFGLQPMTDDIATLQYRTRGRQKAPVIVRTRGHRLEGIWHTGSPIQMLLGSLRGMYLIVPRDMTRAAAFYNTMLLSDEPALIIECLNGYRLREPLPENIGEITLPLGVPEILKEGDDVTIVTYGSCVRICQEAVSILEDMGISCELIDCQTLIPFDRHHLIARSLQKTSYLVLVDEDVPGGATAYMLQKILEEQNGFWHLDAPPVTVTAKEHRCPYGSDGDYFSKPNVEDVVEAVYRLMHSVAPKMFPMYL